MFEYLNKYVFVHQEIDIMKVLKRFYMEKSHSLCTPMIVKSLDVDKDPFRLQEKDEELLGPEVLYLMAVGTLVYLANYTRPNISFVVNLLARYNSSPTKRHWCRIKHILCYLKGNMNMSLFYPNDSKSYLISYADASYLSNPHNGRSQTGYLFTCNGTTISWQSVNQTIIATSSNCVEILALHEANHECVLYKVYNSTCETNL